MSDDGGSFVGSWSQGETQFEPGSWNGTRTSPLPPPVADVPESEAEPPAPGPDSALARLIRRFQDQVEADLKLPLYRTRGRQLWAHGDEFQAALRKITPATSAESRAKAAALRAGFQSASS